MPTEKELEKIYEVCYEAVAIRCHKCLRTDSVERSEAHEESQIFYMRGWRSDGVMAYCIDCVVSLNEVERVSTLVNSQGEEVYKSVSEDIYFRVSKYDGKTYEVPICPETNHPCVTGYCHPGGACSYQEVAKHNTDNYIMELGDNFYNKNIDITTTTANTTIGPTSEIKFGDLFIHMPTNSLHQCLCNDEGKVWYLPQGAMEAKWFDLGNCSKNPMYLFPTTKNKINKSYE